MALTPLHDSILFVFDDEISGGGFNNKTASGIVYKSIATDMDTCRWATVLAVGKDVKEIVPKDNILIENLKWTEGCKMPDGSKVWRTDEKSVMCVR